MAAQVNTCMYAHMTGATHTCRAHLTVRHTLQAQGLHTSKQELLPDGTTSWQRGSYHNQPTATPSGCLQLPAQPAQARQAVFAGGSSWWQKLPRHTDWRWQGSTVACLSRAVRQSWNAVTATRSVVGEHALVLFTYSITPRTSAKAPLCSHCTFQTRHCGTRHRTMTACRVLPEHAHNCLCSRQSLHRGRPCIPSTAAPFPAGVPLRLTESGRLPPCLCV